MMIRVRISCRFRVRLSFRDRGELGLEVSESASRLKNPKRWVYS